MTFSLTVLGSSAAVPAHSRNLSAHLLNANERLFLIDCGEGTQFQLKKYHIPIRRICRVFISHLHGDHFFGLIGLVNTMHLLGRKEELHLHAPAPLKAIFDLQLEASQTSLAFPLVFHDLRMDTTELIVEEQHITVRSFPLRHSIPTCGFVFREKNPPRKVPIARSYAYCSDTAYTEDILPVIGQVGLIYHETTFAQDLAQLASEKLHSTSTDAAAMAKKAGAGKLIIGHFSARYENTDLLVAEARSIFPETYPAEEGTIINI